VIALIAALFAILAVAGVLVARFVLMPRWSRPLLFSSTERIQLSYEVYRVGRRNYGK